MYVQNVKACYYQGDVTLRLVRSTSIDLDPDVGRDHGDQGLESPAVVPQMDEPGTVRQVVQLVPRVDLLREYPECRIADISAALLGREDCDDLLRFQVLAMVASSENGDVARSVRLEDVTGRLEGVTWQPGSETPLEFEPGQLLNRVCPCWLHALDIQSISLCRLEYYE